MNSQTSYWWRQPTISTDRSERLAYVSRGRMSLLDRDEYGSAGLTYTVAGLLVPRVSTGRQATTSRRPVREATVRCSDPAGTDFGTARWFASGWQKETGSEGSQNKSQNKFWDGDTVLLREPSAVASKEEKWNFDWIKNILSSGFCVEREKGLRITKSRKE